MTSASISRSPELSPVDLWNSASCNARAFDYAQVSILPAGARAYLTHAIAAGTSLVSAVRLRMHGEIKLKNWCRFSADEVIFWGHGMVWHAVVRMHGLPIRGSDRLVDGDGAMRWNLFGIVPIVNASGPDITRSAAGRVNLESIWLPSVLCSDVVSWTGSDRSRPHARFTAHNETAEIDYVIDNKGRLQSINMPRWCNPEGSTFRYANFGGVVEREGTFGGYAIPTRVRAGWHFGTDKFDSSGEFFRVGTR